jgi:hypothetical protein
MDVFTAAKQEHEVGCVAPLHHEVRLIERAKRKVEKLDALDFRTQMRLQHECHRHGNSSIIINSLFKRMYLLANTQ